MLEAGQRAPEFSLPALDGSTRTSSEILAAGPVLLALFKVSCPVCQYALPFLERLHQAADGLLQFFAVSQDDARATRGFLDEFGIRFPALLDEEAKGYALSNAFNISYVPSLFLVEADGTISWATHGFSRAELERLGKRVGASPFLPGEKVPDWKAG